jgi:hypothetical protein
VASEAADCRQLGSRYSPELYGVLPAPDRASATLVAPTFRLGQHHAVARSQLYNGLESPGQKLATLAGGLRLAPNHSGWSSSRALGTGPGERNCGSSIGEPDSDNRAAFCAARPDEFVFERSRPEYLLNRLD